MMAKDGKHISLKGTFTMNEKCYHKELLPLLSRPNKRGLHRPLYRLPALVILLLLVPPPIAGLTCHVVGLYKHQWTDE